MAASTRTDEEIQRDILLNAQLAHWRETVSKDS